MSPKNAKTSSASGQAELDKMRIFTNPPTSMLLDKIAARLKDSISDSLQPLENLEKLESLEQLDQKLKDFAASLKTIQKTLDSVQKDLSAIKNDFDSLHESVSNINWGDL